MTDVITARETLEFGGALPVFAKQLGIPPSDKKLQLFHRHVVQISYYRAQRIPKTKIVSIVDEARKISTDLHKLYVAQMTKPKLHFSTHIDLTFARYASMHSCVRIYLTLWHE